MLVWHPFKLYKHQGRKEDTCEKRCKLPTEIHQHDLSFHATILHRSYKHIYYFIQNKKVSQTKKLLPYEMQHIYIYMYVCIHGTKHVQTILLWQKKHVLFSCLKKALQKTSLFGKNATIPVATILKHVSQSTRFHDNCYMI